MGNITDLPYEILDIIRQFVMGLEENPKELVGLIKTCRYFHNFFIQYLFYDIWIYASHDNSFRTDCSIDRVKALDFHHKRSYHGKTLIIDVNNLINLLNLFEVRPDYLDLVKHFHFNGLNFARSEIYDMINKLLDNSNIERVFPSLIKGYKKRPHRIVMDNKLLPKLPHGLFGVSMFHFFGNNVSSANINEFANPKKRQPYSYDIESSTADDLDEIRLLNDLKDKPKNVLFHPADFEDEIMEYGFFNALRSVVRLMTTHSFETSSFCVLNLIKIMNQSSGVPHVGMRIGHDDDDNDSVSVTFIEYNIHLSHKVDDRLCESFAKF